MKKIIQVKLPVSMEWRCSVIAATTLELLLLLRAVPAEQDKATNPDFSLPATLEFGTRSVIYVYVKLRDWDAATLGRRVGRWFVLILSWKFFSLLIKSALWIVFLLKLLVCIDIFYGN